MILLCVDTSLAACSACVYDSTHNKILAEECELMERGHAEALPPMVARVMVASGIQYGDLNRIAVTTGPGTFTGIRIGLSFARALGLSLSIKVVGIDTPTALRFADVNHGLPQASGFAEFAASLPNPEAMPNPNYLRDADAKPQTARLRELPDLQIVLADKSAISTLGPRQPRRRPCPRAASGPDPSAESPLRQGARARGGSSQVRRGRETHRRPRS